MAARVILALTRPDYHKLGKTLETPGPTRYLWECAVQTGTWGNQEITVAGPAMGAPFAVMVLEKLIALGAKEVLALGWCGSLRDDLKTGSLVVPTLAVSGDGVSRHYLPDDAAPGADPGLGRLLQDHLAAQALPWQAGPIWTTDAFYRETEAQVRHYQGQGILAVEMELAALYAVGQFRGVAVAGLLVVSDELSELTWRPGFSSSAFRRGRQEAVRVVLAAAAGSET